MRRGLTIPSTGQALAEDVRFSFETRARGGAEPVDVQFDFLASLLEAPTGSRPVISAEAYDEVGEPIDTVRVEVYRLPGMAKAIEAYHTIVDAPRWARWSTAGVVATDGLRRVVAADAELQNGPARWFLLPEASRSAGT